MVSVVETIRNSVMVSVSFQQGGQYKDKEQNNTSIGHLHVGAISGHELLVNIRASLPHGGLRRVHTTAASDL